MHLTARGRWVVLPPHTPPARDCVACALVGTLVLDTALLLGWLQG